MAAFNFTRISSIGAGSGNRVAFVATDRQGISSNFTTKPAKDRTMQRNWMGLIRGIASRHAAGRTTDDDVTLFASLMDI